MKYWVSILFLLVSLNAFTQDSTLINRAIHQLDLDQSKIKTDLVVTKVRPNNPKETILVIPEIEVWEEDEYGSEYFELNSYILIVDSETGKINHKFYESSETNGWVSDAMILSDIIIDTAPYSISEKDRAFGIRVKHYTMSQPNPYRNETISLFVATDDVLKKVLSNYEVTSFFGEGDADCYGEFTRIESVLIISSKKTSGFYDVLVKSTITDIESGRDEDGECNAVEKVTRAKSILKFNDKEYK